MIQVSFEVAYSMNMDKYYKDMSISTGVLCSLAVVYTVLQTWGWSNRAGKMAIDFITLTKFLLFLCGNLSNMFFVVMFGNALWWLIFFKVRVCSSPVDKIA